MSQSLCLYPPYSVWNNTIDRLLERGISPLFIWIWDREMSGGLGQNNQWLRISESFKTKKVIQGIPSIARLIDMLQLMTKISFSIFRSKAVKIKFYELEKSKKITGGPVPNFSEFRVDWSLNTYFLPLSFEGWKFRDFVFSLIAKANTREIVFPSSFVKYQSANYGTKIRLSFCFISYVRESWSPRN